MSSDSTNVQPSEGDGPEQDAIRALNQAIDVGDTDRFAQLLPTVCDLNAYDASGR